MKRKYDLTVEKQEKIIKERLHCYKFQLTTVINIFPILEKYEGKKITKHIETTLKKAFPELDINLRDQYGMFHIKAQPAGDHLEYEYISMLIGYDNDPFIRMNQIKEYNKCYTLNAGRVKQLEAGQPHIKKMVEKRNQIIKMLDELKLEAEMYNMTYDFDLEKSV